MNTMSLNGLTKIMSQKEGRGYANADSADKGGWGNADNGWQRGEGGSGPPILADIICEQP